MTVAEKAGASEKKHSAMLKNREKLTLDGVTEVISFDDTSILLRTLLGSLTILGEGLHITRLLLDCGEVSVEGKISDLSYTDGNEKGRGGLFRKLG